MSHNYPKDEFVFPSVTTVIGEATDKDGLVYWSAGVAVDYIEAHWDECNGDGWDDVLKAARTHFKTLSTEALEIGSEVHELIEKSLIKKRWLILDTNKDEVVECYVAFCRFWAEHKVKATKLEHTVYGDSWAGTLDFKGLLDGKKTLLDWKTSKAIYWSSMGPQLAAYWVADNRECEQAGILRLDKKTGEYELKLLQPKRLEKYYREYQHMVALYFERHPIIAKKAGVI